MNCLAWNCRGLGNPRTVQEIARLVHAQDPSVVFLIETWQDDGPLERLRCQLQFENKFVACSRNKGGGLCLFWKAAVKLRVQSFSASHIDAIVNENQPDAWRLTGFYGAPKTHLREESWTLLRRLSSHFSLPWCCLGDFNELIRAEEKQGRIHRSENQMQRFRDAIDDCGFLDLGYQGPSFTWTNNRVGDMTWERLDRALATPEWLMLFPTTKVHHLEGRWSDHKPILVSTEPMRTPTRKLFRFEEMWTSDAGCEKTIAASWKSMKSGVPMYQVWDKIHACRKGLRRWSYHSFGSMKKQIHEVEQRLKQAETNSMMGRDHLQYKMLQKELHTLLGKEERMWRQRSRSEWLQAGDKNTRYFHCRATQRRRRNRILQLKDSTGSWTTHQTQVPHMFINFYNDLFTSANPSQVEQVVEKIPRVVTSEMNHHLTKDFMPLEVIEAVKQMSPIKSRAQMGYLQFFTKNTGI
jgi:hypothetical protein